MADIVQGLTLSMTSSYQDLYNGNEFRAGVVAVDADATVRLTFRDNTTATHPVLAGKEFPFASVRGQGGITRVEAKSAGAGTANFNIVVR